MNDQRDPALFDDYFDSIYAPSNDLTERAFEHTASVYDKLYGRYLPANTGARILDIGCGCGQFLRYLEKKGYYAIEGIDVSPGQIAFCSEHLNVKASVADAFDYLPGHSAAFDLIVCNDVVEHIPKEQIVSFLKLVNAALRPGGNFFLKCPNMGNPFSIYPRYKDFTHACGYTDISIRQVLHLARFRDIEVLPSTVYLTAFSRIVEGSFLLFLHYFIRKLFWWQGYVAPQILSPNLFAKAVKR